MISNGRISAHLEYVDRGEGTHRGDITRAGTNPQHDRRGYGESDTEGSSRTYSTSRRESSSSSSGVDYSQTGADNIGRTQPVTSTRDRTSAGRSYDSSSTRTSSATSTRTNPARSYDSTSTRTNPRQTYDSTSTRTNLGSSRPVLSRYDPSRRTYDTFGRTGVAQPYGVTSGRTYVQSGTQRLPYDPFAARRGNLGRQPYVASERQRVSQPDRRGYYQVSSQCCCCIK